MDPSEANVSSLSSSSDTPNRQLVAAGHQHQLYPFTFGIEIEYCFGLSKYVDAAWFNHPMYVADEDVTTDDAMTPGPKPLHSIALLEPNRKLQQAGKIIEARTGQRIWRFGLKPSGITYRQWHLTQEMLAFINAQQIEKISELTHGVVTMANIDDYSWFGQELVSRILNFPDIHSRRATAGPDIEEVRKFYAALEYQKGDDFLFVAGIENSGLHMHVGLPPTSEETARDGGPAVVETQSFDLKLLQHLAYILIEYEHVISILHHPQRRGFPNTKSDYIATSNRMGILGHRHTCGQYPLPALERIQATIFSEDMTTDKLAGLLSSNVRGTHYPRDKFVNWTNVNNTTGKRTLEFRQHHGTLNANDVEQWIFFVCSLIRAAERKARHDITPNISPTSPTFQKPHNLHWGIRQGRKYGTRYESEDRMMEELFDMLMLRKSRRVYWRARATKYKGDEYTRHDWYEACRDCLFETDIAALRQSAIEAQAHARLLASDLTALAFRLETEKVNRASNALTDTEAVAADALIQSLEQQLHQKQIEVKDAGDEAVRKGKLVADTIRVQERTRRATEL